jgi:hypothetical protein
MEKTCFNGHDNFSSKMKQTIFLLVRSDCKMMGCEKLSAFKRMVKHPFAEIKLSISSLILT